MPEKEAHPWLWFKLLIISSIFMGLNTLFYWGLFFQVESASDLIAPRLAFSDQAPEVISGVSNQDIEVNVGQILFMGDQIRTQDDFAEISMGQNRIRLAPNTHVELLELNFTPQPSYSSSTPAMVVGLKKGELWVNAFGQVQVQSPRQQVNLSQSLIYLGYDQGINELSVFSGVGDLLLLDEGGQVLNQIYVPLLTHVRFTDDQLSSDFTNLKPSKLKKELKFSGIEDVLLEDPWVTFYQAQNPAGLPTNIKPIYSSFHYHLRNAANTLSRLLAFTEVRHEATWQNRADYTVRYWLGGILSGESEKKVESVEVNWQKVHQKIGDQKDFEQWTVELFFQLSWGDLGSAEFALKETLFDSVLAQQGPASLRQLVHQAQLGLDSSQLGRSQRFAEKWLEYWKDQDLEVHSKELQLQFEMMQQLGLYYPESISAPWLITLDQSAQLLAPYTQGDEEFELTLTENRLAQVSQLVEVYRYSFAKDYLRSSYEQLPIAGGQELSPSQEVFFELGKLLAQRIEYAELTFEGAALPIDEEQFARFVIQSRQSDLLSSDLEAFLKTEEENRFEDQPPSFLPTLESALEILQLAELNLDETNIQLSQNDPFAFELVQARFKDLDEVERSFDALYYPLNNTFTQMVVEGESIPGVYKLSDLSQALSLPQLLEFAGETIQESDFSELFGSSSKEGDAQARASEELARQLAFNQLRQAGFNLPGPQVIRMVEGANVERVLVLSAALEWSEFGSVSLTFELDTTRQQLYNVKEVSSEEVYFEEIALSRVVDDLFELLQSQQIQGETLEQLYQVIESQPVTVNEESIRFLNDQILQVTQITLNDLNVTFNAIFDAEKGEFTSLVHPLYSSSQIPIEDYILNLLQAYVDDFLTQNELPVGGNWNLKPPFNRVKVSNYELDETILAFTLNLEKGVFENVQVKGNPIPIDELDVEGLRGLLE